jgi:hypothetical protein
MPTGYRLELASSARAGCNGKWNDELLPATQLTRPGPKPCNKTKIGKGELRIGTWVEIMGNGSFKWRHWGCKCVYLWARPPQYRSQDGHQSTGLMENVGTTPKMIGNLKEAFPDVADLDGCKWDISSAGGVRV